MTLQERSDLVLTFARVLHVNGQSTDETLAAAERLGKSLDLRARIIPDWGELHLQAEDASAGMLSIGAADPIGVDMDRVASAMRAIDEVGDWPARAACRTGSDQLRFRTRRRLRPGCSPSPLRRALLRCRCSSGSSI